MYQKLLFVLMFTIGFGLPVILLGQTEEELYQFTLQNAIPEKEITTASKSSERVEEAPGIVTVVTAEEIKRFGALSLLQILDRMTSIYMLGTPLHPNNVLSMRGDNSAHYTQKVLILLNGRPVRESLTGGILMPLYNSFPVHRIDRLEIVRGPGSVLYGTGAFTGVINIITKNEQPTDAYFTYGGFERLQAGANAGKTFKKRHISGGINLFQEQGWDFTTTAQFAPEDAQGNIIRTPENTQTIQMGLQGFGANVSAQYGNFTFDGFVGRSDQDAMFFVGLWLPKQVISGTDTTDSYVRFRSQSSWAFGDLGYRLAPTKNWNFETHFTYNYQRLHETDEPANDDRARSFSSDFLLETTHYFKLNNKLDLTLGGLVNRLNGSQVLPQRQNDANPLGYVEYDIYNLNLPQNPDPFLITPRYNETQYSLYGQLSYRPTEELRLILGGQYNKVPLILGDFVPRLAIIYNYNPLWGGKLLLGQAFRSAAATERTIDFFPIILGTPDLLPEKVTTFEAQVFHNSLSRRFRMALTGFYSRQRNLISIVPDEDYFLSGIYRNTGNRESVGVEVESFWQISQQWLATFSATYQQNQQSFTAIQSDSLNQQITQEVKVDNITGMPELMAKIGLSYTPVPNITLGLFNSFFLGNDFAPVSYRNQQGQEELLFARRAVNAEIESVNWLTFQADFTLEKVFGGSLSLSFYGENLLDQEVNLPEYTVQAVNTLPGRGGRTVYLSLKYQF